MNDFIAKPLDPEQLIWTVRHHVDAARGLPTPPWPVDPPAAAGDAAALAQVVEPQAAAADHAPPSRGLPSIEGIDRDDASTRIGDDVRLFASLLARVLREFLPMAHTLPPPKAQWLSQLHKLKGAAGMIGARRLATAAAELEAPLKECGGEPALAPPALALRLTQAQQQLSAVLQQLDEGSRAFLEDMSQEEAAEQPPAAPDLQSVQRLTEQLKRHDLAALDSFQALSPALRATWGEPRWQRLRRAVDDLQFAQALEVLAETGGPAVAPVAAPSPGAVGGGR
jgi:HPt (histidine-containing phosphotransfer) domain-containing protein